MEDKVPEFLKSKEVPSKHNQILKNEIGKQSARKDEKITLKDIDSLDEKFGEQPREEKHQKKDDVS
jgi:hypothetical protein